MSNDDAGICDNDESVCAENEDANEEIPVTASMFGLSGAGVNDDGAMYGGATAAGIVDGTVVVSGSFGLSGVEGVGTVLCPGVLLTPIAARISANDGPPLPPATPLSPNGRGVV